VRRHAKASSAGSISGTGSSRGLFPFILGGCLLLLALVLPAAASAATYIPGTPASFCSGTGTAAGECGELKGVAVDQSNGHVYVVDQGNFRIDEFDSSGTFIKAFGADVDPAGGTGPEVCTVATTCKIGISTSPTSGTAGALGTGAKSIAVDSETHVVYVLTAAARVAYFNGTTGAFIGQTEGNSNQAGTPAPSPPNIDAGAPAVFGNGSGVAVDASNPLQHYLYVAVAGGSNNIISKLKISASGIEAGAYVCQITGTAVETSSSECGGNGVPAHKDGSYEGLNIGAGTGKAQFGGNLAVDSLGNVFVAESIATLANVPPGRHVVSGFAKTGDFLTQFLPSGGTPPVSSTEPRPEAVAALPSGNLLVAAGGPVASAGGTRVQEYNPSSPGSPLTEFGQGTIGSASGGSLGIAADASGNVYVADKINKKIWKYSVQTGKKLKVTKNGTGIGTVTSLPVGINCGSECEKEFPESEVVVLTGAPGANTKPVVWTGCDELVGANECKVTMSAEKDVTATFNLEQHLLTVTKSGTGGGSVTSSPSGISCSPTCSASFNHGIEVTLTGVSDPGSQNVAWEGCSSEPTPTECKVTMTAAKEVKAKFDLGVSAPTITALNPSKGPLAGGNTVTITGTNLTGATEVKFGANAVSCPSASCALDSATQLTAKAPAGTGTVNVTVTTPGGTSADTAADDYTYVALPTVTAVNPNKGPLAGGNSVTVTGTNLQEATFKFGANSATSVVVNPGGTSATMNAPSGTGTVSVIATTPGGESANTAADDYTYVAAPTVVTTAGATAIAQTAATVAGTVNPNGDNVTSCKVKYGTTTAYGSEADCASLPGSGSSPGAVSKALSGLSPNTTYHFKFFATNTGGTGQGVDREFKTLPNAPTVTTTGGATAITQTVATVAGTVNPNGGNVTACKVEYGTTAAYGSEKACASLPGAGSSPAAVSAALSGLTANTTYHFRVVATNAGGTANGTDQTFATLSNTCETDAALCPPPNGGGGGGGSAPNNVATPGAAKPQGQAIALKVTVPGAGSLLATGKNMVSAKGTAKAAGTVTLKLKLNSAGKKQLKKKGKVKVKVKIVFTPTGGTPGTTTKSVTFKKKK
jgi:hypothetical protein